MPLTRETIQAAARTLEGAVLRTPTVFSGALSERTGAKVYLKLESLQHTGSFKVRGALVKLLSLSHDQRRNGVIAISAGNHAQGVAYHARRLGIPATIVMPKSTPFTKVNRTEALGARVLLHGDSVSGCRPFAEEVMREDNLAFIHPFDDEQIIAGQGTVGLEVLEEIDEIDAIIAPIGGGGLISGIAIAAEGSSRPINIIGVEAALYPSMYQTLRGEEVQAGGDTIAEGIAIKTPGTLTFPIVRDHVGDLVVADELALEDAVQTMIVNAKVLTEGAGAAPLAALLQEKEAMAGRNVGLMLTGGNVDAAVFRDVLVEA